MIHMYFKRTAIVLALALVGCSNSPTIQDYASTASPTEEVQKFDADLLAAKQSQVDVLSPTNYDEAQNSLKEAKADLDKQKDSSKTLHAVAEGRAYLTQALAVAKIAHSNIEDVITARGQALQAEAPKSFSKDFSSADKDLRKVTTDIEKNDLSSAAKNRTELQAEYLNLELLSIKNNNLHEARELIDQSIKEGAKSLAPRTLAIAEKNYKDTDAFITGNRHDEQVKVKSEAAKASAFHALKITRASKSDKKTSPEELALQMESAQTKVAEKDSELDVKKTQLAIKNRELTQQESQLQGKDAELSATAADLRKTNQKADDEKAFNQKYETARAEFKESEAEVYKQGDTLIIRLKALEFPQSKADLKPSNFSLLAKVQKVIKSFGDSSVVVEGHTDSIGGKEINERISTARAEAIREYLIANAATEPGKITAIGYDYQKPLATNKTASGRAQNRRVDIRIQPEKSTSL
jgi:outer membrane protein OmpA-like peptidoglycan-associated protein